MSTQKAKNAQSPAKPRHKSTEENKTAKKKRKQWMKVKFRKIKPPPKEQQKAKEKQMVPPKDAQQFSANWKALQEILKTSQPEKKQPVLLKHQNGALPKKETKVHSSKSISKNNAGPMQTSSAEKSKRKPVPNSVVPKDSQVKVPNVSEPRQTSGLKRKMDSKKSNSGPAAKAKKLVTEVRKPTEDDLWFDDVDPDDIEAAVGAEAAEIMRKKQGIQTTKDTESTLVKEKAFEGLTKAVAVDCEMVGVGLDGRDSILARVSLVNQFGKCIYDKFVRPTEKVTDYRTAVSGIRPEDIRNGEDVQTVQKEVADILQGRIVVGHAVHNDLKILCLGHPKKKIRDTQKYKPFRKTVQTNRPSLKALCKEILNVNVQQGEHSSVQDAQATMRLYTMVKKQWEAEIKGSKTSNDSGQKKERKPRFSKNKDKKKLSGL